LITNIDIMRFLLFKSCNILFRMLHWYLWNNYCNFKRANPL